MKAFLVLLLALSATLAPASATPFSPAEGSCPGRVAVIQRVNHPEDYAGSREHKSAWAADTQAEIEACVADGTLSRAYGYYLDLSVMGRLVRYICFIGDRDEKRNALGEFDAAVIEPRPAILGSVFSRLTDELAASVHSDCQEGRL